MLRNGVIHSELAALLAGLRHTETFVVCDSGLPLGDLPRVDLGYRYGAATFVDVINVVLPALIIQNSWISKDMIEANQPCLEALQKHELCPQPVDHSEFKLRVLDAKFAVRTGEATFYANVICEAGVPFQEGRPM